MTRRLFLILSLAGIAWSSSVIPAAQGTGKAAVPLRVDELAQRLNMPPLPKFNPPRSGDAVEDYGQNFVTISYNAIQRYTLFLNCWRLQAEIMQIFGQEERLTPAQITQLYDDMRALRGIVELLREDKASIPRLHTAIESWVAADASPGEQSIADMVELPRSDGHLLSMIALVAGPIACLYKLQADIPERRELVQQWRRNAWWPNEDDFSAAGGWIRRQQTASINCTLRAVHSIVSDAPHVAEEFLGFVEAAHLMYWPERDEQGHVGLKSAVFEKWRGDDTLFPSSSIATQTDNVPDDAQEGSQATDDEEDDATVAYDADEDRRHELCAFLKMAYENPDAEIHDATPGEYNEEGLPFVGTGEKLRRYSLFLNALALQEMIMRSCTQKVLNPIQIRQLSLDTLVVAHYLRLMREPETVQTLDVSRVVNDVRYESSGSIQRLVGTDSVFQDLVDVQDELCQFLRSKAKRVQERSVIVPESLWKKASDCLPEECERPSDFARVARVDVFEWSRVELERIEDMLLPQDADGDTMQARIDEAGLAHESFLRAVRVQRVVPGEGGRVMVHKASTKQLCKDPNDLCDEDFVSQPRATQAGAAASPIVGDASSPLAACSAASTVLLSPTSGAGGKSKQKKKSSKPQELVVEDWMLASPNAKKGSPAAQTPQSAKLKKQQKAAAYSPVGSPGDILKSRGFVEVHSQLVLPSGRQYFKTTVDVDGTKQAQRLTCKPPRVKIYEDHAWVMKESDELARRRRAERPAFPLAEPTGANKKNKKQQASAAAAGAGSSMAARTDADDLVLSDDLAQQIQQALYADRIAEGAPERIYPCILQYADRQRRCCLTHQDGRVQVRSARDYKHAPRIQQAWKTLVGLIGEIGLDSVIAGQEYEGPGVVREDGPDAPAWVFNRTGFRAQYLPKKK